jgi:hypothetical protein
VDTDAPAWTGHSTAEGEVNQCLCDAVE